jgi:hypothetical protein
MSRQVDVFAEDRAHEAFLVPMIQRLAREEDVEVDVRVRAARGGHGRAVDELKLYQRAATRGIVPLPDLLIAAIDGNCSPPAKARLGIQNAIQTEFFGRVVVACPDPHVERWYMADPESFRMVVGRQPRLTKKKCQRGYYKNSLTTTVRQAGHPATLGGIEFARELVDAMDLYRAGRNDRSLRAFVQDLRGKLGGRAR